jgi:hypothetical protein
VTVAAYICRSGRTDAEREMGLGSADIVSLAEARERAKAARELLSDGRDPIAERKTCSEVPTFGQLAEEVIESLENGWVCQTSSPGYRVSSRTRH